MFNQNKSIEELDDSSKINEALEYYEEIVADDPSNTIALYCKAEALSALGQTDQAIDTLMKAIKNIAKLAKSKDDS